MMSSPRTPFALILAVTLAVSLAPVAPVTGGATAQLLEKPARGSYDRHEVPGHYTIGFYGDDRGTTHEIELAEDQLDFDVWLGITGDSTRVFSGIVMKIDLPPGVDLGGPILWKQIPGLKQAGTILGEGIRVQFFKECQQQKSHAPVMLARIPMKVLRGINEFTLEPGKHVKYGLSVELCQEELSWPKPYADPVSVRVHRKLSLWKRIQNWF